MFKIIIILFLLSGGIHSNTQEHSDLLLDQFSAQLVRIGDPILLFDTDLNKMKEFCEKIQVILTKDKEHMLKVFNGMMYRVGKTILPQLAQDVNISCVSLSKADAHKVIDVVKSLNKHMEEAKLYRFGLMTVLTEASKNNTKTTFPELICHLKQFCEKMEDIYKGEQDAKVFIEKQNQLLFGRIIKVIEEETEHERGHIKLPAATCKLPEAKTNPSQFQSIMVPLLKAIENMESLGI